jgi:hypothetical protein
MVMSQNEAPDMRFWHSARDHGKDPRIYTFWFECGTCSPTYNTAGSDPSISATVKALHSIAAWTNDK